MKIYRRKSDGSYYFMTTEKNGLFCFSLSLPDRETLQLCSCSIGCDGDKEAWRDGIVVSDDIYKRFNSIYDKDKNYDDVCSLIMDVFKDVDRASLDKSFRRNDKVFDLTDRCIKEYGREVWDAFYSDISRAVDNCMKIWNGDEDRVVKWIVTEKIPELNSMNHAMVDVFGKHHPTEYKLLHKFYNYWGSGLDYIIKKCIEKYPDENDFDLATYMCEELLKVRPFKR